MYPKTRVIFEKHLDYHVLDGSHELAGVDAVGLEVSEQGAEGPLVTLVLLVGVIALDVVRVVLVDAVVAQVHARVPQVLAGGIVPDLEECSKSQSGTLTSLSHRFSLNLSSFVS